MKKIYILVFSLISLLLILSWCLLSEDSKQIDDKWIPVGKANATETVGHTTVSSTEIPEGLIKYKNTEYGLEMMLPNNYEVRSLVKNDETTGGCVKGEQIEFYFYKKGDAPENLVNYWSGLYAFSAYLKTSDYKALESSVKDNSFCGPVFESPEKIVLKNPFKLTSSSIIVFKPIQSQSCGIDLNADFKNNANKKKYAAFTMREHLDDLDLSSLNLWKSECPEIFSENVSKFSQRAEEFDTIAKSFSFTDTQN